jgi:hypothetical protein
MKDAHRILAEYDKDIDESTALFLGCGREDVGAVARVEFRPRSKKKMRVIIIG